jgi:hypothetical protein
MQNHHQHHQQNIHSLFDYGVVGCDTVQMVTDHYALKTETEGSSRTSVTTDKTSRCRNNQIKILTNKHLKFQNF